MHLEGAWLWPVPGHLWPVTNRPSRSLLSTPPAAWRDAECRAERRIEVRKVVEADFKCDGSNRLATTLLTFMLGSFVLLLHVPRVIAQPGSHIEWVMLGVSMSLAVAGWVVRASLLARPGRAQAVAVS